MEKNVERCIIFGVGSTGKNVYEMLRTRQEYQIIGFSDNDSRKHGSFLYSLPVIASTEIKDQDYDIIFIASLTGESLIRSQLISLGVAENKINSGFVQLSNQARLSALTSIAKLIYDRNILGSVAELGVFQGEFAKEISRLFPDRTLYLFDTFEGFDERDIVDEVKGMSDAKTGELNTTSIDLVLDKIPHKNLCVIKKGYFPQTAEGVEDTFAFVNLDPDLYNPIISGLRYFYPRMADGGIIFIHDYFNPYYSGVKKAVWDFQKEQDIKVVPIGDDCTLAVVK